MDEKFNIFLLNIIGDLDLNRSNGWEMSNFIWLQKAQLEMASKSSTP
jgi:hypothetical protein